MGKGSLSSENEPKFEGPDINKIDCRDCYYRIKGKETFANCKVFSGDYNKPMDILFENAKCKYKVKE